MNKVTTIHINGRSYTVEESGYEALSKYLEQAHAGLAENPDKEEIIKDLEQAIAEKIERYITVHKNVVLASEIQEIIAEMGPVGEPAAAHDSEPAEETKQNASSEHPKKLYQIREGAMISGVCMGLAAYFNVDVTLVRLLFVVFTIITHGAGILVYLVLMFVIPHAQTSEQQARAHGVPFTAQEFINRAKAEYGSMNRREWKRNLRAHKNEWKREWRQTMHENKVRWGERFWSGTGGTWVRVIAPIIGIATALITVGFVFVLLGLIATHAFFGFIFPAAIPLWILIVILVCIYNIALWPLRAIRYAMFYSHPRDRYSDPHEGWLGFVNGVMWIGIIASLVWLLYTFVPETRLLNNDFQKYTV